jgi:cytochrome b pre-mRNA-processing protein 3
MFRLFRKSEHEVAADSLYRAVVAQARLPHFYEAWGVDDTMEGRFELISLHAFLVLHRLKLERDKTEALSQSFFDLMFADVDRNLREMGVGDMGVGKRVKRMVSAFYGRISAYEQGLSNSDDGLRDAVLRNVYGGEAAAADNAEQLAAYIRQQVEKLGTDALADVLVGPSWSPIVLGETRT